MRAGPRPLLLLGLAALIPVVLIAALFGFFFFSHQQAEFDAQIQQNAQRTASLLARELDVHVQLLTVIAESPRLDPPFDLSGFAELASRLQSRVPQWDQVRVSNPAGEVLLTVPPPPGAPARRVVDEASHHQVVATAAPAVGEMVVGPQGRTAFPIRVPVIRGGKVVYVLSAVLRPTTLVEFFDVSGVPDGWPAWIVNAKGEVVAATGVVAGQPPSTAASNGGITFGTTAPDGTEVRAGAAPLRATGWTVVLGVPVDLYRQPIDFAFRILGGTALTLLVLVAAVLLLLSRELRVRQQQELVLANWQRLDALGKLSGGVAHDFNNLLMSFQSGVEGLQRRRLDEKRFDRTADMMLEAVERGKTMTQRLLAFSRRSDQHSDIVDLRERLDGLRQLLHQSLRDDIDLTIEVEAGLWPVKIDLDGFDVTLVNLATNARDAMPRGGRLTITFRNVAEVARIASPLHGPHVEVAVADTGSGIRPEELSRVFDPFFTTKGSGNTGLGLSQVYGFAKRSGGAVLASSVPGAGSVFTLYLPRAGAAVTQPNVHTPAESLPFKQALVVDDAPEVAEATAGMLRDLGIDTLVVSAGQAAIEAIRTRPDIDLMISDITMPGMSGFELASRVQGSCPSLNILLMTGYSEHLERGHHSDFPVLSKPFGRNDLMQHLRALSTPKGRREADVIRFGAQRDR